MLINAPAIASRKATVPSGSPKYQRPTKKATKAVTPVSVAKRDGSVVGRDIGKAFQREVGFRVGFIRPRSSADRLRRPVARDDFLEERRCRNSAVILRRMRLTR